MTILQGCGGEEDADGRCGCSSGRECYLLLLPPELLLFILARCGLSARDLVQLDKTCSAFHSTQNADNVSTTNTSLTEAAARSVVDKLGSRRLAHLQVCEGCSWKQKLHVLEHLDLITPCLATGSYQNLFINQSGGVVAWGGGRLGQLGRGINEDSSSPVDITSLIPEDMGRAVQVSAGCAHSAIVTDQGLAFTFGDGRYNQLGHSNTRVHSRPHLVRSLSHIHLLQVACGSSHTLFLDAAGFVYSVGQGDNGQLGQGHGNKYVSTPLPIELPDDMRIMQIDAGVSHNVLVSYCGKLLTHGFGGFGQLGHGGSGSLFSPKIVFDLLHVKIVFAAAGPKQTVCVDSRGQCYAFGWGADGTLALGNYENTNRPRFIEALEGVGIKMVAASQDMSLFVSFQGTAYWSGVGMGQMEEHKTCLPTVIRMSEQIEWGSLGDSHAVLLTRSGTVLTVGKNGRGQAGQPETEQTVDQYKPVAIHDVGMLTST